MKEQAFQRKSSQHTFQRLEVSSSSGGVLVAQMDTLHNYDGYKQMGGGQGHKKP